MKSDLEKELQKVIRDLVSEGVLSQSPDKSFQVVRAKDPEHGDFSSNVALVCAPLTDISARALAETIRDRLAVVDVVKQVDVAGPGFINFFLNIQEKTSVVTEILSQGAAYGCSTARKKNRVHLEYVSANPTGPLHVGHGRSAAYGSCVANILRAVGCTVHTEYYVNDAGRQMRILALSVWLRYMALHNEVVQFPEQAYQGDYVIEMAQALIAQHDSRFHHTQESLDRIVLLVDQESNADKALDCYIEGAREILGHDNFDMIQQLALTTVLSGIQADLSDFGVTYDDWFHESQLLSEGMLQAGLDQLKKEGHTFEKEGALWFRATDFEDEKDRVLVRSNGQSTYFASDVAYHLHKYSARYTDIIDVFGSDHHGYIQRITSFLRGLGQNPDVLHVLLVQFAILYRGAEKISMSTRRGEFVTLRTLYEEVGVDAARFFYVMRRSSQHMDFDLELAKSETSENPVYYIQYAHARIASVCREFQSMYKALDRSLVKAHLSQLVLPDEDVLLRLLKQYPEDVLRAADRHEPHVIAHFLLELATAFHSYYNSYQFLVDDLALCHVRVALVMAVKQVIANGLSLLGISAPEKM